MLLRNIGNSNSTYFLQPGFICILSNFVNINFPCRLFRHKLSTLQYVSPEIDEGNVCPACPKVSVQTKLIGRMHRFRISSLRHIDLGNYLYFICYVFYFTFCILCDWKFLYFVRCQVSLRIFVLFTG